MYSSNYENINKKYKKKTNAEKERERDDSDIEEKVWSAKE